jgi:hypothetical protein
MKKHGDRRRQCNARPRKAPIMPQDHWLPVFSFNVEEWDAKEQNYETLAMCRTLALARAAFEVAIKDKPAGRFMIRSRTRVVRRHPEGNW